MARKTLGDRVDELRKKVEKLTIKLECHLTEFKIIKKIGYILLVGILGILAKVYWEAIISSPTIVGNVIAALNIT